MEHIRIHLPILTVHARNWDWIVRLPSNRWRCWKQQRKMEQSVLQWPRDKRFEGKMRHERQWKSEIAKREKKQCTLQTVALSTPWRESLGRRTYRTNRIGSCSQFKSFLIQCFSTWFPHEFTDSFICIPFDSLVDSTFSFRTKWIVVDVFVLAGCLAGWQDQWPRKTFKHFPALSNSN